MNFLNDWYANMTKWQKVFVYLLSTVAIVFYGIGLIPLLLFIYLELGVRGRQ